MKLDEIQKCFISETHYQQTKQIKDYILENNMYEYLYQKSEITKGAIQAVGNILEDTKSLPIQKVLSTRLVKEIMDCHIVLVIEKVSIKIIPIYEQILIGYCEKGQKAKQYFSDQSGIPLAQKILVENKMRMLQTHSELINLIIILNNGQLKKYNFKNQRVLIELFILSKQFDFIKQQKNYVCSLKQLYIFYFQSILFIISINVLYSIWEMLSIQALQMLYLYIKDEQLMVLGNTFIRLVSESVFVWNIWHPYIDGQQSAYSKLYNLLVAKGLQFPKLFYFKSQKVKEFYVHTKEQNHSSPFVHSNEILPDFFYIKKRLDINQFQQNDLIIIRNELLSLKNSELNPSQEKFIKNFEIAYKDFQKTQRFDDLQITIQSICLEFDDEVFDKQAAIDAFQKRFQSNQSNFTPSKLQGGGGGYSTDKISQFLSHGSMSSQNSSPNDKKQQLQILNEKNRRIEQLLLENSLLQKQIKNFEDQIHNLKQNLFQNNE